MTDAADLIAAARKATGSDHIGAIAEAMCLMGDGGSSERYERARKQTPITAEIAKAAATIMRRSLRTARRKPETIAQDTELRTAIESVRELLRWTAGE